MQQMFQRSPETEAIVAVLRGVNLDIAYGEIARQTKLPLERMKELLSSARRVLRNEGIMFGTVRNYGLRRMGDREKVQKSEDNKKRISRAASRALKEIDTIEAFELLPPVDQLVVTTNRAIFSLTRQQAKTKATEPLRAAATSEPNAQNILALAKGNRRA